MKLPRKKEAARENQEVPMGTLLEKITDAIASRFGSPMHNADFQETNGSPAEVCAWMACYDHVEDALYIIESQIAHSKRQKKRRAPMIRALSPVRRIILQRLAAIGVHPMQPTDFIDYSRHEPVEVVSTCVRENNGRIVEVLRIGFVAEDRVVRLQRCIVMRYIPQANEGPAVNK